MLLSEWVSREGRGAITRLMRETGLAYSTVHGIVNGDAHAGRRAAKLIADATGGEVLEDDLILGNIGTPPKKKRAA